MSPVAVALAALVLVGTTDWWHTTDAEDLAPAPLHDHASHHPLFKASPTTDSRQGDHCYLCHWLRSFQNGLTIAKTYWLTGATTQRLEPIAITAPRRTTATLLPARAPPV
jgi:hypothetical protein